MPSDAVNPFGPDAPRRPKTVEAEPADGPPLWQVRRERAVWYGVVGIGLMFAGQISTAFAIGGAGMVLFGISEYVRWTRRRPSEEDPWNDTDIDDWEQQHYGRGDGLDDAAEHAAPEVVDANPDEAWGVHERRF